MGYSLFPLDSSIYLCMDGCLLCSTFVLYHFEFFHDDYWGVKLGLEGKGFMECVCVEGNVASKKRTDGRMDDLLMIQA